MIAIKKGLTKKVPDRHAELVSASCCINEKDPEINSG